MRRRTHSLLLMVVAALTMALAIPTTALATESHVMHRLYNPYTGEHLYTKDTNERDELAKIGWRREGEGWTAPTKSATPVYRLYNPYVPGGDHHYTKDANEYSELKKVGWRQEGVGWYSDDAKGVALYRLYNPYAKTGTHHYTADAHERDELKKLGWRYEGVAWYGVRKSASTGQQGSDSPAGPSGGGAGYRYTLQSGVTQIGSYSYSGSSSFTSKEATGLSVGDKFVLEATTSNPYGAAGTVTAVKKNADGTTTVSFRQATKPSEIFYSLEAAQSGVVISSSNATIRSASSKSTSPSVAVARLSLSNSWSPQGGAIGDSFRVALDNSGSYVAGNFSVKPTLGYNVKWTLLGGLERCQLEIDGDARINAEAHVQNKNADKDVKILEAKVPVAYGFAIEVPLYVHVSVKGDLSVSVDYDMGTSIRLVDDEWVVTDKSDFETEIGAAVNLRLGGKVGAELKWLGVQIVDASVDAGASGSAKTTVRTSGLVCGDLSAYAYLGVDVGTGTDYLVDLGWTLDKDIITEKNSPLRIAWHFEDGSRVSKCTWNGESEGAGENPSKPGGSVQTGTDPNFDGLPFYEDEGWGNRPKWQGNKDGNAELVEPFYIDAGTSMTIKAADERSVSFLLGIDGDTVYRITEHGYRDFVSGILMDPGSVNENESVTIEVLIGRMKVWEIIGTGGEGSWSSKVPTVTFGSCKTETYPVELSETSLTMHVGDTYELRAAQSVTDLYERNGFKFDERQNWSWSTDNWRVADVTWDDSGTKATVSASAPGETYVRVGFGGNTAEYFERLCKITVVE